MKKIIILLTLLLFIFSCGGQKETYDKCRRKFKEIAGYNCGKL